MDFALILVLATFVTGLIWALDSLFFRRARTASGGGESVKEPVVVEYAKSFFPVLLLVLILRSFLFEPFRIPSESMLPTLHEGDFIFVNKFVYGLRLPVLNTKVVGLGEPERGDVVVFRLPSDPSVNYIKRVVGLPGDIVHYDERSKRLTINDKEVPLEIVGPSELEPGRLLAEELLGDSEHFTLLARGVQGIGGTYRVPEGHYFMMGDNRDNSRDSRYGEVGFVPEFHLVGRAERIWMNWRPPSQGGPQWSRIGKSIE